MKAKGGNALWLRRCRAVLAAVALMLCAVDTCGAQDRPLRPGQYLQDLHYLAAVGAEGPLAVLGEIACAHLLHLERQQNAFWDSLPRMKAAASAQLILEGNPFTLALMRLRGRDFLVWREDLIAEHVPELNPDWLEKIRDKTPMPDFRGVADDEKRKDQLAVYDAFCQAVLYAQQTPLDLFIEDAKENAHVTFAHLWTNSNQYRGMVIPLKGTLLRMRKFDAPNKLRKEGLKFVYEGWIKGLTPDAKPFVVIFPIAPEDRSSPTGVLEPAEQLSRPVSFYGYYLKLFRYAVIEKGKSRDQDSPMLVGPTLVLERKLPPPPPPPPPPPDPVSEQFYILLGGFGAVVVGLIVGLSWWFRGGDHAFRQRVRELHTAQALEMVENAEKVDPASGHFQVLTSAPPSPQEDGRANGEEKLGL